jgi:hypothetical protein
MNPVFNFARDEDGGRRENAVAAKAGSGIRPQWHAPCVHPSVEMRTARWVNRRRTRDTRASDVPPIAVSMLVLLLIALALGLLRVVWFFMLRD